MPETGTHSFFKKPGLLFYLLCISQLAYTQCIPHNEIPFYFCEKISRNTLENYLSRAVSMSGLASFQYEGEILVPIYNDEELEGDLSMLINLQPKFIGRAAGEWFQFGLDELHFERAAYIAERFHSIDPDIILQAAVFEHIENILQPPDQGIQNIIIPNYVEAEFGLDTLPLRYFDYDLMVYDDWISNITHKDVPDITKLFTQMWIYYRATRYISIGYEAVHFGQFAVMNDNDICNYNWGITLKRIREFAKNGSPEFNLPGARRGIVICDAHTPGLEEDFDAPYFNCTDTLLFDLLSFPSVIQEGYKVNNPDNYFDGYDRTCYVDGDVKPSLLTHGYGGITASEWGWTAEESNPIPMIIELDEGQSHSVCEGENTSGNFECQSDQDPAIERPRWLIWGWDEITYFALQSESYRNYLLSYFYETIHQTDKNAFFQIPLRRNLFAWHDDIYKANNGYGNQETAIKWIWNNSGKFDFCDKTIISSDFTKADNYLLEHNLINRLSDVNGDHADDIITISSSSVFVKTSADKNFSASTVWLSDADFEIIKTAGKRIYLYDFNGDNNNDLIGIDDSGIFICKSTGINFESGYYGVLHDEILPIGIINPNNYIFSDFNADHKIDIAYFDNGIAKVALSNGLEFELTNTSDDIWNETFIKDADWDNQFNLRLTGDVNGDEKQDVIEFGDNEILVGIASDNNFEVNTWLINDFCKNQNWNNTENVRLLADVNGDGMDDVVGFGYWGVMVSLSTGEGFSEPDFWIYNYGTNNQLGGWINGLHIRTLADMNGDNMFDIVGFGNNGLMVSMSTGSSFSSIALYTDFDYPEYNTINNSRLIGNTDDDKRAEIIAFGEYQLYELNCDVNYKEQMKGDKLLTATNQILIFPNPAKNFITVQIDQPFDGVLQVINAFGEIVISDNVNRYQHQKAINFSSDLPNGIYLISISNETVVLTGKFIKFE